MKYLKCVSATVAVNALCMSYCEPSLVLSPLTLLGRAFVFSVSSIPVIILPVITANIIDASVHQKFIDNKPLQYGLTALEASLGTIVADPAKLVMVISTAVQALAFKYILDSENASEEVEIDNPLDQQLLLDLSIE